MKFGADVMAVVVIVTGAVAAAGATLAFADSGEDTQRIRAVDVPARAVQVDVRRAVDRP